jgi:hypothetical protein
MNQFIFEAEQALLLLNVIPSIIVSYTYQNNLLKYVSRIFLLKKLEKDVKAFIESNKVVVFNAFIVVI